MNYYGKHRQSHCLSFHTYYRYADPNYSINEMPLTEDDCRLLKQAVEMLDDDGKATVNEVRDVLSLVRERLTAILNYG